MLITFSGLDGAGKSTMIAWLRAALEAQGHAVAVLHMHDDVGVYAYVRTIRDRLLRRRGRLAPSSPRTPRDTPARSTRALRFRHALRSLRNALVWSPTVRSCIYAVDLLIFAVYRLYFEKLRNRVLLMDRYFYDTLVDLSKHGPRPLHRLLEALTPAPDVPVLLHVPPERAFERKREYSLEYLERRWVAYQSVFSRVPQCVALRNGEAQLAQARLWQVVTAHTGRTLPTRARLERTGGQEL